MVVASEEELEGDMELLDKLFHFILMLHNIYRLFKIKPNFLKKVLKLVEGVPDYVDGDPPLVNHVHVHKHTKNFQKGSLDKINSVLKLEWKGCAS